MHRNPLGFRDYNHNNSVSLLGCRLVCFSFLICLIIQQHRSVTSNPNAFPYVLFNDNATNMVSRDLNASNPHSMPTTVNGIRLSNNSRNYRYPMSMPMSPAHNNVINISSSDDDTQAMPINLSRKRMLRDSATVVH